MRLGPVSITRVGERREGGFHWDFPHIAVRVAHRWFFLPAGYRATRAIRTARATRRAR